MSTPTPLVESSPFQVWQTRFQKVTDNNLWTAYLRWAYQKCVSDFADWSSPVNFMVPGFTAMLCGTAGATTSREFVAYVLGQNPQAKIIILDIGAKQIEDSQSMVRAHFPNADITCLQADARLMPVPDNSVDLIETDGVFEFMSGPDVQTVLHHWHRILKVSGKCMFRDFAPRNGLTSWVNGIKKAVARNFFNLSLFNHTWQEFNQMFATARFKARSGGGAFVPSFRRFTLIKES